MARSAVPFDPQPHLQAIAAIARDSKEYQGHGWGCAWLVDGDWRLYHDIKPIWEDVLPDVPDTTCLVVHARSAFRDEGIVVENNMPFCDGRFVFAFNGELRGVRIKEEGRIGAEKIFNYVKRFDHGDMTQALQRGTEVIERRSRYVRAMNIVMASADQALISSRYGEDPDYFQLRTRVMDGVRVISSQPYPGSDDWQLIDNGRTCAVTALDD
ncbi:MAG: hypothetical protein KDK91_09485 [Gammaproteobacteria bacterium]|nr:hypothetical protein [Gammaproteobacteria bacterium]